MNNVWTIKSTLEWTTDYFRKNDISEARLDAEILLSSVLNYSRLDLNLKNNEVICDNTLKKYKSLIIERKKRKPVAYILGEKEFYGLTFKINEHTLIPRPETELLVEHTIDLISSQNLKIMCDIGTGSANIAISIAKHSDIKKIYATDINLNTLKIAYENVNSHGTASKIILKHGNLFDPLISENVKGKVDIIVSNPPYISQEEFNQLEPEISFEPDNALSGGLDGLDFFRKISLESKKYFSGKGYLVFEMNSNKTKQIIDIVDNCHYKVIKIIKDYSNLDRVLIAKNL